LTEDFTKDELFNVEFYKTKDIHFIIPKTNAIKKSLENNDKELLEFIQKHDIEFLDKIFQNMTEACLFLIDEKGFENVIFEGGISSYLDYFTKPELGPNVDCLILTIFRGKINDKWIRCKYPSLDEILKKFKIVFKSQEMEIDNGTITFLTLVPIEKELDVGLKKEESYWYKIKNNPL